MSTSEDPGWRPVIRSVALRAVPVLSLTRRARNQASPDALTALRVIWCSLVVGLFLFWVTLTFIRPDGPARASWFPYFLIIYGVCALAIAMRRWGGVAADDPDSLAARYRTVFFIVVGLSESIALLGYAGTFLMRTIWIYPLGLAMALFGMWWIAPTAKHLQRDQERLSPPGRSMSLMEALVTGP